MKYMGSKNRVAKNIVPILQECIDKNNIKLYVEPFVGGANIIDKIKCKTKIGTDINPYLIELLKYTRDNYEKENCFLDMIEKDYYDKVRASYNKNTNEFSNLEKGIVGFLASYNGRFFEGSYSGIRTIKSGKQRNYYDESKRNLLKQAPNLKGIRFDIRDYKEFPDNLNNILIYCDPPYQNTTNYKVGNFNHNEFWEWIRKVSINNFVLVSEENAPDDFEIIWSKENINRSLDCEKRRVINKTEKLFTYKNGKYFKNIIQNEV